VERGDAAPLDRRTVITGAAWSLPVIALAVATPTAAASGGGIDLGAFTIVGDCGDPAVSGVQFVLTASSTAPLPEGTAVRVSTNNPGQLGMWSIVGGTGWVDDIGGTRFFDLTAPVPAGSSIILRSDLDYTGVFTLDAIVFLPEGYAGSGDAKTEASVTAASGACSAG
jgi:hypothetical protein